ncbi:acyl-CoA dehydrogenase family protein [Frankia sp. CNm7]|uniref:Acyl-CoA dehydrogenase family protein n=1 Tax=Frankia nepalensis TaxID=1836974 RepID=A0A937USF6_9ACTN|nr:acyl-CoA dehydrogenase family protein [Frankia nepalensis]MBL7497756.1 acyl-CoA dehydrogenase family protein [Frankia nepalensis]MBL7512016.1 acyl-CoA dehydrogenase family protein [Frankia nepalensis]MBL7520354.1 acyl-CoA dehydrogenase family protein [Frankia nepalensis]MBL7632068.1 acyl-CoA dehydrogenase family protein [Frankia nepalensis]
METDLYEADHEAYRETAREFIRREVVPKVDGWDRQRAVDRETWTKAGAAGLTGLAVPERFGGAGVSDYRYRFVVSEEIANVGAAALQSSFGVNDDIVLGYLLEQATEEQKARWLPGFASGETISAIAMSEPEAGSDLRGVVTQAVRRGDGWLLNGSKTFISNGVLADLVIVFAKTDQTEGAGGYSLFVVERGMPGFERGRKLDKVGLPAQDTAELFFRDVEVPADNLLGGVGEGLRSLMRNLPRERLGIAVAAQCSAEASLRWTLDYVRQRRAFGRTVAQFQTVGFALAELRTQVEVTRAYLDRCVRQLNAGTLSAVDAAKAKWWATDVQWKVIDTGVQLHGGYGYMTEYPIARAFMDARVQRIYGGTNEIMKEIISRDLLR